MAKSTHLGTITEGFTQGQKLITCKNDGGELAFSALARTHQSILYNASKKHESACSFAWMLR